MIYRQKTRASSIHRFEDAQRMQRNCLYCFGLILHRSSVASDRYNTPPRVCGDYNSIKMNNDTTPRMRGLRYIPAQPPDTTPRMRGLLLQVEEESIQPRVCGDYESLRKAILVDSTRYSP